MDNRWYHAIYSFGGAKMLNAVGVDVSKGKSTISVLQPGGVIVRKPFDVTHSKDDLKELARYVKSLDGETKVVMECTGRYHEPLLRSFLASDIFVCAVNPHLIKNYGNNSLRKVKSDPADSRKIARYALDNWAELRQYSTMDTTREQLGMSTVYVVSALKRLQSVTRPSVSGTVTISDRTRHSRSMMQLRSLLHASQRKKLTRIWFSSVFDS